MITTEQTPSKPFADPFPKVPAELKKLRQWIVWREEPKANGGTTKRPYIPGTSTWAKTNDPSTWTDYQTACEALAKSNGRYHAVGVVMLEGDGLVFIDLDDCRNRETGDIEPWAQKIVRDYSSFTEVSPSGEGLHILVRGVKPGKDRHPEGQPGRDVLRGTLPHYVGESPREHSARNRKARGRGAV